MFALQHRQPTKKDLNMFDYANLLDAATEEFDYSEFEPCTNRECTADEACDECVVDAYESNRS